MKCPFCDETTYGKPYDYDEDWISERCPKCETIWWIDVEELDKDGDRLQATFTLKDGNSGSIKVDRGPSEVDAQRRSVTW